LAKNCRGRAAGANPAVCAARMGAPCPAQFTTVRQQLQRIGAAHLDLQARATDGDRRYRRVQCQHRAVALGIAQQCQHQRVAVDDAGAWRKQPCHRLQLRLQRQHLAPIEGLQVIDPIGQRVPPQLLQRSDLGLVGGDDQLAATSMGHAVAVAEIVELATPGHAQPALERALRVVDAGVDDFAVARAGGGAKGSLGFQYQHLATGQRQRTRHRQPDHSRTHHHAIHPIHARLLDPNSPSLPQPQRSAKGRMT